MPTAIIEHIHKVCDIKNCGYRPQNESDQIYCFGCSRYIRKEDFSMLISEDETQATEKLQFVGDNKTERYVGDNVNCRRGDVVVVSVAKKAQLLRDHPKWFVEDDKPKKRGPKKRELKEKELEKRDQDDILKEVYPHRRIKQTKEVENEPI